MNNIFLYLKSALERIASALERLAPPAPTKPDFVIAEGFVWHADTHTLAPVARINRINLALLKGIDWQRETLSRNTLAFATGLPANNVLLWGARGMGKSSLVKAVHGHIASLPEGKSLKLIEIHRDDIGTLNALMNLLRDAPFRFILFCDDLSFEAGEAQYKSLKAILEGGIEGRSDNVLFYATSNRRHLIPRDMMENQRSSAIHPGETVDENISLSDRFGLWLGFHHAGQDAYLEMVLAYAQASNLPFDPETLKAEALEWSITRGSRSGRTACQFIQHWAMQ